MKISLQITWLALWILALGSLHAQTSSSPMIAPTNDDCLNATPIDAQNDVSSTIEILGDFNGSTLGIPSSSCSGLTATAGDIWYTFTASATRYILDAPDPYMMAELYQGDSCGSLTYMYCKNGVSYLDGLVAGNQYYLKLIKTHIDDFSPEYNLITFRLVKSPDAPANDLCDNAILLTGTAVSANLAGANLEITTLPPFVSPNSVLGDVWFKFVASENYASIVATPTNTFWTDHELNVQLYTGTCGGLTLFQSMGQFDNLTGGNTANTNQLQIGQTYYIRVLNSYATVSWPFTINAIPKPSPAQDVCDNAINITLDADGETQFSIPSAPFLFATPTTGLATTCNAGADTEKDLWYQFTAAASDYLITPSSSKFTAYTGNCGALTQIGCGNGFILSDLTPGQDIYLRTFTSGAHTIRELAASDECPEAITLVPSANPAFAYSSTFNATPSASPTTCFASGNDVWFEFTATSTKHKITVSNGYVGGSAAPIALTLYSGDCTSLQEIACYSYQNANPEPELDNYVVGQTYYIKITRSTSVYFGIKITHINTQPNDLLANASEIYPGNLGECTLINGSTEGTVPTAGISYCSTSPAANLDVWYWFIADSEKYKTNLNTTGFHQPSLYKETAPGVLTQIYCATGELSGFEIGAKYYIRIAQNSSYTPYTFTFCISKINNSPANDSCGDAIPISVSPDLTCVEPVTGNFTNATFNMLVNYPNGCGSQNDKDVWFRFTPATAKIIISNTVVNVNNSIRFSIIENNCEVYNCVATGSVSTYGNQIIAGLTPEVEYLLAIRYLGYNDFSFCLSTPPTIANDSCANAIVLTPSINLSCTAMVEGYSGAATATIGLPACAANSNSNDVWFQFTATQTEHSLDVPDGSGIQTVQLFTGSCASLACVGNTFYGTPFGGQTNALFSQLAIGTTYYMRVVQSGTSLVDYRFCLNTPMAVPSNNEHADAITLIPSADLDTCNPISGHFNRATFSSNVTEPTCLTGSGSPRDIWYKFTATSADHQLQINLTNPDAVQMNFQTSLYTSINNIPTQQFFCFNQFDTVLNASPSGYIAFNSGGYFFVGLQNYTNLNVGETYFIRVYPYSDLSPTYNYNTPITFDICLKTLQPIPVNKDVTGALPLPVSQAGDLQYVTGYATRAPYFVTEPFNAVTNPCGELGALVVPSNMASNVWYTFTATHTSHELNVTNDADVLFPFSNFVNDEHYPLYAALYEYNGAALETKHCYADTAEGLIFGNLEVGKQYFLKMMYAQINYVTDFEFEFALSVPEGLGVDSHWQHGFSVYPNPAQNTLIISSTMPVETIVIYNLMGQVAKKAIGVEDNRIDVASLASGVYLAKINDREFVRFVKQ